MKITLKIQGMHCASCVAILTRALKKIEGVTSASVNYSTEKAMVEFDNKKIDASHLIAAIKSKGSYDAFILKNDSYKKEKQRRKKVFGSTIYFIL